jgi:hypothetical protein
MDVQAYELGVKVLREEFSVNNPDIFDLPVGTGGEEGDEGAPRILVFTGEDGFKDGVQTDIKDLALGGVLPGLALDILGV